GAAPPGGGIRLPRVGGRGQGAGRCGRGARALPGPHGGRWWWGGTAMTRAFDDAIVGAGIVGLAHAYHLARRGRRVIVLERGERAQGASVRNFGMLWPIGQPAGPPRKLALRSLEIWRQVLQASGLWHDSAGSLHLAYRDDE